MKKFTIYSIIVLIAFAACFLAGGISSRREADRLTRALLVARIDKLQLVDSYEVEIGGLKRTVYEKEQLVLTKNEAIKTGYLEKERYRKLYLNSISHVADLTIEISILKDSLSHTGVIVSVPDPVTHDERPAILLPFTFQKYDRWIKLDGTFDVKGTMYYSLVLPDIDIDLTIGMKKKQPVISAMTTYPYISAINISSVQVVSPDRFYNKTWFKVGIGFAGGVVASHYLR